MSSPHRPTAPGRPRTLWAVTGPILALLLVGALSLTTINEVRVGGPQYEAIAQAQNLESATATPSQNLLGARGVLLALAASPSAAERTALVGDLLRMESAYNEGHAYWDQHITDAALRQALLVDAHTPAARLFRLVHERLVPAIERGEKANTDALVREELLPLVDQQAAASAVVASLARTRADTVETTASGAVSLHTQIFTGLVLVLAVGVVGTWLVSRRVHRRRETSVTAPETTVRHAGATAITTPGAPPVAVPDDGPVADVHPLHPEPSPALS